MPNHFRITKAVIVMVSLVLLLSGCTAQSPVETKEFKDIATMNFENTSFENYVFPADFNIRKYDGVTLNFIVENTINANILSQQSEEFAKLTGINVNIRPIDYDTVMQKINLDIISETGNYQIIYCDPYRILNTFHEDLQDLSVYMNDPTAPKLQVPLDDFFDMQFVVDSYFEDDQAIRSIPFDATTMIFYYRADVFEAYADAFYRDMGYDWTPGTPDFSWERYIEVSKWIDRNVPNDIVKYGSGQMAQNHNSLFCEFSNVLASNGGDYFLDKNFNTYGLKTFDKVNVMDESFKDSLALYKRMVAVSAPESINWSWAECSEAFAKGDIAMMMNWDENYVSLTSSSNQLVADNVACTTLPYGTVRSANIFGGSGIGINKMATDIEKEAAWFFITWATSADMQVRAFMDDEGGGLPTIKSAYEEPQIKTLLDDITSNASPYAHVRAVLNAWQDDKIYLRPKISNFYDVEKALTGNISEMLIEDLSPEETQEKIYQDILVVKNSE